MLPWSYSKTVLKICLENHLNAPTARQWQTWEHSRQLRVCALLHALGLSETVVLRYQFTIHLGITSLKRVIELSSSLYLNSHFIRWWQPKAVSVGESVAKSVAKLS